MPQRGVKTRAQAARERSGVQTRSQAAHKQPIDHTIPTMYARKAKHPTKTVRQPSLATRQCAFYQQC